MEDQHVDRRSPLQDNTENCREFSMARDEFQIDISVCVLLN